MTGRWRMGEHEEGNEPRLHRRQLLMLGAGLLLSACAPRRGGSSAAPAAARPVRSAPVSGGIWYAVEAGDTLSSISRRSGLPVAEITQANRLNSAMIRPGQRLFLPGAHHLGSDPLAGLLDRPNPDAELQAAPDGGYRVIRRGEWTDAAIASNHRAMGKITRITVHHTGEYAGTARLSDREILRRIDRYHREGRKWAAIGYHYLIAADGRIYEGRPERIQGAHTRGNNSNNLGISMMGDFHRSPPSARHLAVLNQFLSDTRLRLKVPKQRIYGHRDLSPSICPGDQLYAWLGRYKAA